MTWKKWDNGDYESEDERFHILLIPHDYRTDEQKMIDKVLKKFRTKKKN